MALSAFHIQCCFVVVTSWLYAGVHLGGEEGRGRRHPHPPPPPWKFGIILFLCTFSIAFRLPISDPFLGTTTLNVTGVCSCDCSAVDPVSIDHSNMVAA